MASDLGRKLEAMTKATIVLLEDRDVVAVGGADARSFLQRIITNDVGKLSESRAIYAALATASGRYLFDFFIYLHNDKLLLECERHRRKDLIDLLSRFKLRAKVTFENLNQLFVVVALFGIDAASVIGLPEDAPGAALAAGGGIWCVDPRLAEAGIRGVCPRSGIEEQFLGTKVEQGRLEDYDFHRLSLGLPDGSRDMIIEKSLLLECNLDELNAIDWQKGCFIGQEVTTTTKRKNTIRRRLVKVEIEGGEPAAGQQIILGNEPIGTLRSVARALGIAVLPIDILIGKEIVPLHADAARIRPRPPFWMRLEAAVGSSVKA